LGSFRNFHLFHKALGPEQNRTGRDALLRVLRSDLRALCVGACPERFRGGSILVVHVPMIPYVKEQLRSSITTPTTTPGKDLYMT
jgi:hypothetical protein